MDLQYFKAMNDLLFFWKSKLQNSVVLSSFEAEYIALSECTREIDILLFMLNIIPDDLM